MNESQTAIFSHAFNGVSLQTGDILCTHDGVPGSLFGQFWALMGKLTPGEVDHTVLYTGPGGRCVELAIRGVIAYEMPGGMWDAPRLDSTRRLLDRLVGVVYPLAGRGLSPEEEQRIRINVANFCLEKARRRKPYNLNFFKPETDGAFDCSQLIYKAYLSEGIDLNTNAGVPAGPVLGRVIFPSEIWNGLPHQRCTETTLPARAVRVRRSSSSIGRMKTRTTPSALATAR